MMDHKEQRFKSNDPQERSPVSHDRGESAESDYYYDDSTNYEIYHDESDEPDEDDSDS